MTWDFPTDWLSSSGAAYC